MMSDKKRQNRNAKGQVMIMLSAIGDEKKQELIGKYMSPDQIQLMSEHSVRVLVGNWFNHAVRLVLKGATDDEINRVLEHVIVLMGCRKYNLDYKQSYKDHDLLGIVRKYFGDGDGEIHIKEKPASEKRIDRAKKREQERLRTKLRILNLQDKGFTIEEIAKKFNKPESTIRAILEAK